MLQWRACLAVSACRGTASLLLLAKHHHSPRSGAAAAACVSFRAGTGTATGESPVTSPAHMRWKREPCVWRRFRRRAHALFIHCSATVCPLFIVLLYCLSTIHPRANSARAERLVALIGLALSFFPESLGEKFPLIRKVGRLRLHVD